MSRNSLSGFERFALAAVAAMAIWKFGLPHTVTSKPAAPVSPPPSSSGMMVSSSTFLAPMASPELKPGTALSSRDGDPCKVLGEKSGHPKGLGVDYSEKSVRLYCSGKTGRYVLNNIGLYKNGKLVSSTRKKIPDGNCHLLSSKKGPLPNKPGKKEKYEFIDAIFRCNEKGKEIWEEVSSIYKSGKTVATRLTLRSPASLKEEIASAKPLNLPKSQKPVKPTENGVH